MKPLPQFEHYLQQGIVKKQAPDKSRANNLRVISLQEEIFLKSTIKQFSITDDNAGTIVKNAYDVIMERIRAHMLDNGYHAQGIGGHEAEVAYLRTIGVKETEIQFLDQLRYIRNGIHYYGKPIDAAYAKKVVKYLDSQKLPK